jgi:gluconolactonase
MLELVPADAELELLVEGLRFTEGPIWVAEGEYLLFSDVLASTRHRWDERDGLRQVAGDSRHGNGMTLDRDGRLIVCEGETGAIVAMDADGTGARRTVIAAEFRGARLNSPNDVVVRSDGLIYFTDPWWAAKVGVDREQELDVIGVYRVEPGGEPELLVDSLPYPNGLCFSPDESTLYVDDTDEGSVHAFDLAADGSLSGERLVAEGIRDEVEHVDGIKSDERGNLWVTGPGGVWVLASDGTRLGLVGTPARAANMHWGGPDWSWLFITASSQVFRIRTTVAGRREPFMR